MSQLSTREKKRQHLFQIFSDNLKLLIDNEILKDITLKSDRIYICPLCLDQFTIDDLNPDANNRLTFEDVPPKSLKGKPIALTCHDCNSICGHSIDYHLLERMEELDFQDRIEGATQRVRCQAYGKSINGEIRVLKNGKTKIHYNRDINNPKEFDEFIRILNENVGKDIIACEPKPSRVNPRNLQVALLKIGYLKVFAEFGYSFILDSEYDKIREQLLNPDSDIYPIDCWFMGPFPKRYYGVPFIIEKNLESIFTLFGLHTQKVERTFGVVIPLTTKPIEKILLEIRSRFKKDKIFNVEMYAFDPDVDYLSDLEAIRILLNWINRFKKDLLAERLVNLSVKDLNALIEELQNRIGKSNQ